MKKFVLDYAADVAERIVKNSEMKPEHKVNKLNAVIKVLSLCNLGAITTDEAMRLIAEV